MNKTGRTSAHSELTVDEIELQKRMDILKRLRGYLKDQRERLSSYLKLLDSENDAMERGDSRSLEAHLDAEGTLITQIRQFQKVIDPLQRMYALSVPEGDAEVIDLEKSLEKLRHETMERVDVMREKVRARMEIIRSEIASLRIPRQTNFHAEPESSGLLDISA